MPEPVEILDACSLLSLYASQHLEPVLRSRKPQCCIVDRVYKESLYIRKHIEETSELDYEPVSLNPFLESGLIKLLFLETEEEKNLFIELAANLDDGESATIALAIERQMNIVTEDRKAIRIFNERKSANVCTTTLDLIKEWQKKEGIDRKTIQTVLKNIVEFGSYKPGRNHHLFDWWNEMIRIK